MPAEVKPTQIKCYGWHPSLPDIRDAPYAQQFKQSIKAGPLPRYVDLSHKCPPIWSQGMLGSCTAHGIGRAFAFDRSKLGFADFMPARRFIYWNERYLQGTVAIDSGASVRDGIRSIAKWGVPPETLWPYDISQFRQVPSKAAYVEAERHQAVEYAAIDQNVDYLKAILASGYVFVFGFSVYSNFEDGSTPRTGMMFMPDGNGVGGHCVCAVGYNSKNYFCCANSWGTSFGDPDIPGHFWMPPQYISNPQLASDFWVVKVVES